MRALLEECTGITREMMAQVRESHHHQVGCGEMDLNLFYAIEEIFPPAWRRRQREGLCEQREEEVLLKLCESGWAYPYEQSDVCPPALDSVVFPRAASGDGAGWSVAAHPAFRLDSRKLRRREASAASDCVPSEGLLQDVERLLRKDAINMWLMCAERKAKRFYRRAVAAMPGSVVVAAPGRPPKVYEDAKSVSVQEVYDKYVSEAEYQAAPD